MEPKGNSIEFKIWLNQSEKSFIADVRLGSKYASVSTTLNLTFKRIKFQPKRNKILRVNVKDKSCNSPEGLKLY